MDKKERISLVWAVRAARRDALKAKYLSVESRIIPCCATCEHNKNGVCSAMPSGIFGKQPIYNTKIVDNDDLCMAWGASFDAFLRSFRFSYQKEKEVI